ncbi:MAG TPA: hypothetical protein VFQ53_08995 [Kofleriaceae bacterium]|nr:hypothetical protein [Kofleriaceae bacterium]
MLALALIAGCGDPTFAPDATIEPPHDAPDDPFVGQLDEPLEFPRAACTAGALAGFTDAGYWPALGMRLAAGGAVVDAAGEDAPATVALTADDLMVRTTRWTGSAWTLVAIDICAVTGNGLLVGSIARCTSRDAACAPEPITATKLRRIDNESDGAHLVRIGELAGGWDLGTTAHVRVAGDVALLARGADGIRIVSVANPAAPVEIGHFHGGNRDVRDLGLVRGVDGRNYAVTAGSPTSPIVDVTDPRAPQLVAELPLSAASVTIEGVTAYYVDGESSQLQVYDLSRPRAPKHLGTYRDPALGSTVGWRATFVAGAIAYASDVHGSGLHVIDTRDPARPRELAAETAVRGDAWHAPWLTVAAGKPIALDASLGRGSKLRLLDGELAAPTFLSRIAEWTLRDADGAPRDVSIHDIVAIGPRVFVAHQRDGVRVVDISTPAQPVTSAYFNTWLEGSGGAQPFEGALGIDVDATRHRIYVADSIRGLVVLQGDATVFP